MCIYRYQCIYIYTHTLILYIYVEYIIYITTNYSSGHNIRTASGRLPISLGGGKT